MWKNQKINNCWTIGLPNYQVKFINDVVESFSDINLLNFDNISSLPIKKENPPFLLLISLEIEEHISKAKEKNISFIPEVPRALILPKNYTLEQVSTALDADVAEVLRYPLSKQKIHSVLMRSLEAKLVHQDIYSMSREIFLERELLERKNTILSFIVNFVEHISESMDYETILQNVFKYLNTQIPIQSMHVAFWKEHIDKDREAVLYINTTKEKSFFHAWENTLIKELTQQTERNKFRVKSVPLMLAESHSIDPLKSNYISLPITIGKEKSGLLLLVNQMKSALGRDQVEALETTMRYLGIILKNAHLYEIVKQESTVDPLTGLYNRRLFEKFLDQEILKFQRYKSPVSFLLIDIDHFKHINDTMGHDVGDIVLQEVAQIIKKTFRTTDYCFRYGGEEFTVIMPEINSNEALPIAERFRKKIENYIFTINNKPFSITVSIGLSHVGKDSIKTKSQLIQEADEFLYKAKKYGRNCSKGNTSHNSNYVANS